MILVYLAHPVRNDSATPDIAASLASAKRWVRAIEEKHPNVVVVAPWIYACEVWNDAVPAEREAGIRRNLAVIERCDAVWAVGERASEGMISEMIHAEKHGKPIKRIVSIESV